MKTISTLFLLLCYFLPVFSQTAWKLAKEQDEVQVYTRRIPDEPLKEFKAETEVSSSPNQVLDLLLDWDISGTWVDKCKTTKLVKQVAEDHYILHNLLISPWPASDRDMVYSFEIIREEGKIVCQMLGLPDEIPQQKNYVRIPRYRGKWLIESLPNGNTKVVSQSLVDPGGAVPDWLSNSVVVDSPLATMKSLRKQLSP